MLEIVAHQRQSWRSGKEEWQNGRMATKKGGREKEKEEDDDRRARSQVFCCPFCLDSENILS
jgi:hypothetical protein